MWILILTLIAPSTSGPSTITAGLGFTSFEACAAAGNAWLEKKPGGWPAASAVCAKT